MFGIYEHNYIYSDKWFLLQGVKIHVTFPKSMIERKGRVISEGEIYYIKNFFVKDIPKKYKTTSHAFNIQIYEKSVITKVEVSGFCVCMYNTMSINDIRSIDDVNNCGLFGMF